MNTRAAIEPVTAVPPVWDRRTVLRQKWTELAYFHWRYEPGVVQSFLPPGVTVDTHDGAAWVGLIPFEMRRVQLGPTPPVPWLSDFIEINVRTYVTDAHGRRGVWFFSLDVPRSAIVAVARSFFSLPYCWADCRHVRDGDHHEYAMARRRPHASRPTASMSFTVGDRIPEDRLDALDHFLTARWALLTTRRSQVLYGAVHHPPWPLHDVGELEITQNVVEAAGLPRPTGPVHARYSPGVDVQIGWLERVAPART